MIVLFRVRIAYFFVFNLSGRFENGTRYVPYSIQCRVRLVHPGTTQCHIERFANHNAEYQCYCVIKRLAIRMRVLMMGSHELISASYCMIWSVSKLQAYSVQYMNLFSYRYVANVLCQLGVLRAPKLPRRAGRTAATVLIL